MSTIVGALLLSIAALASGESRTISVDEIRPGMKGYGLTVFRGTKPERFDVEVIDVLANFRPGQDLILVRTPHPVLDEAIAVGGMSGSPIYLDGRLAGAYAYGWLFGKEPVAGVTPIENMLREMVRPVDPELWRALGTLPKLSTPVQARSEARARAAARRPARGLKPHLGQRSGALSALRQHARAMGYAESPSPRLSLPTRSETVAPFRVATPLLLSGMDRQVAELLRAELEPFGLHALQTGGSGGTGAAGEAASGPARFVDGGAIGVQLIGGDIDATAIGTVTHVHGHRLVAFGHPMMNAGQPALPTTTARVLHVLASERRSFKIAQAQRPLGTLIHDRQSAIVIDTDYEADTIPMRIRLEGVEGAPRTEWNVRLASNRMLTPMLGFSAMINAISATSAERSDAVFEVDSRVELERHGVVELKDVGYSGAGLANPMALSQLRMFDVIGAAYGNPFEDVRVLGIDVTIGVRYARDVVRLVDAMVTSNEVDPGRDVNVYLTLRRFGEPEQLRIVPVHVPESAAGDKIELIFEPGPSVDLPLPEPDDMETILSNVRAGYPATSLVVSTKLPGRGLRMRGHVVDHLPGSALDTLQLVGEADRPTAFATHARKELPMHDVVFGSARVKLDVREEPKR
ncbi:MAG: SpoIVB peptidase S55 domain-containing protein [Myxococcales bacterium]